MRKGLRGTHPTPKDLNLGEGKGQGNDHSARKGTTGRGFNRKKRCTGSKTDAVEATVGPRHAQLSKGWGPPLEGAAVVALKATKAQALRPSRAASGLFAWTALARGPQYPGDHGSVTRDNSRGLEGPRNEAGSRNRNPAQCRAYWADLKTVLLVDVLIKGVTCYTSPVHPFHRPQQPDGGKNR